MVGDLINYGSILTQLKEKIKTAQTKAVLAVNNELLKVYWEIGAVISEQEKVAGWGSKVVEKLASDLKIEFPTMKGLSPRNLRYMRDFSLAYPQFLILQQAAANFEKADNQIDQILQQAAAKLPWGHHQVLLIKIKPLEERCFYIQKCVENGWSRSILEHQIESGLYKRQGALTHNFANTLPAYQSELTQQLFKDPYQFDFVMLGESAVERDLEDALIVHVTNFLLELGDGFAFMGRQKKFEAGGREFFVDLLFYHTKLRRYIIIELKIGEFEPEYVSKMNLYLGLADDQLKGEFDDPAIGLILCKTKNRVIAEYALRDTSKPIGIAEYKIAESLPENIKGGLPSIEEIELRIDEDLKEKENPVDARVKAIKDKIKRVQGEEIQTPATNEILYKLYHESLKPLYEEISKKLSVFEEDFHTTEPSWRAGKQYITSYEQLDEFWSIDENIQNIRELNFEYSFQGFKKAGTEHYNVGLNLKFEKNTYWYGFSMMNYNNEQPFLKKLYHQDLSPKDVQQIVNLLMNSVLDRMEWIMERINNK
ncbi:MAG: YhcG family protein [Cytophagaceae bacterium]